MGWQGPMHSVSGASNMREHRAWKRTQAEKRQAAERHLDHLRQLQRQLNSRKVLTDEPRPTRSAKRRERRKRQKIDIFSVLAAIGADIKQHLQKARDGD